MIVSMSKEKVNVEETDNQIALAEYNDFEETIYGEVYGEFDEDQYFKLREILITEEYGEYEGTEPDLEPHQEEKKDAVDEEVYEEEPPPDPTAPYDLEETEPNKRKFELRHDQLAEVEQLWEVFQNHTPVYNDLDGFIRKKELLFMLDALLLSTYTPEQTDELIEYCVKPPDPDGRILFEQFVHMVTIRQRDIEPEPEIRNAFLVFDPERSGLMDRTFLRQTLATLGHKMPPRLLEAFIKEIDIANDGTIGVEDAVGTLCLDLNREDIEMMIEQLYGDPHAADDSED